MFKITPNPPASPRTEALDAQAADRALSHYNLGPKNIPQPVRVTPPLPRRPEPTSDEEALANAYSILQSAAATAYENADNQTGSNRKVAMGVVHLIDMAQMWVDSVLDKPVPDVNG